MAHISDTYGLEYASSAQNLIKKGFGSAALSVVSSSPRSASWWQGRVLLTEGTLFPRCKEALFIAESDSGKPRQGNFLGSLWSYSRFKDAPFSNLPIVIQAMFPGRGIRLAPISYLAPAGKAALEVTGRIFAPGMSCQAATAGELALLYGAPLVEMLSSGGFEGMVNIWGDQIILPLCGVELPERLETADIVRVISRVDPDMVSEETFHNKDWIMTDRSLDVIDQIPRGDRGEVLGSAARISSEKGAFLAMNLGPVALSFRFLRAALEIFGPLLEKPGAVMDLDPYLLKAFLVEDEKSWEQRVPEGALLKKNGVPAEEIYRKAGTLKERFLREEGRPLRMAAVDMGRDPLWLDFGQHSSMRESLLALAMPGLRGDLVRTVFGAGTALRPDEKGNYIISSDLGPDVRAENSFIAGSSISSGRISSGTVIDSTLSEVDMQEGFVYNSIVRGHASLKRHSGLYACQTEAGVFLDRGERMVTFGSGGSLLELRTSELADLKDGSADFERRVHGNALSMREAENVFLRRNVE